jgi:acyl carrier protein
MRTNNSIRHTVREFIVENFLFGDREYLFKDSESFIESGIIDSTGILELIEFLEATYNIQIQDDELLPENLDSLENVEAFIHKKRNG